MESKKPKQYSEKKVGEMDGKNVWPGRQEYDEPADFDMNTEFRLLTREMTTAFAFHRMIWDKDGNPLDYIFLEVNKKFEELTGLGSTQLIGKRVREVLPGLEQSWIEIYGEVAKTGKPAEFDNYSRELDRYYEVKAYCPKPGYFAVTFNDITQKRKRTLKLDELKSFYEGILKTVNEGIAVTDQNDVVFFVNTSLGQLTGIDTGQLTGKHVLTGFPDELIGEFLPFYLKAKDSGMPVQYESQGVTPDGRKLILSGWLIPLNKENSYNGMICSVSDITERKKAELKIRESEYRFKALTTSAPNIIFSTNRELRVTYINKTIDNTPAGNVIGMIIYDLTPQNEVPRVKKYIAKLFRTKREVQYEIASKNEFGDYWLDVRAAPIIYGNEIEGLIFILTDITKRKKAEEKLAGSEERFRGLMDKSPVAMNCR
ncbi:MAG: PAS domain-containing protein [Prolixibacteraceae bacterium]|jgi:PAS domain S-box-containing protein|nr:PAS domain-containing protein [Prolixibacteraceae bacterium]